MVTEKQLGARARRVQDLEARLQPAQMSRDALIVQAAHEKRFTQTEIAGFVGLSKMAVSKIVRKAAQEAGPAAS
jgi:DNA-directed RNA polymerase specialized sigma subunit